MNEAVVDARIVGTAGVAFITFIAVHAAIFRRIDHAHAVRWFLFVLGGVGAALGGAHVLAVGAWSGSWGDGAFVGSTAVVLYALASGAYFMGVFGLVATSVRIRLLTELAAAGETGLSWAELVSRYNREMIVKGRLRRFVASGEVLRHNGTYRIGEGVTFFRLPTMVLSLMKRLYGISIGDTLP